jgi:hypothetical protein
MPSTSLVSVSRPANRLPGMLSLLLKISHR